MHDYEDVFSVSVFLREHFPKRAEPPRGRGRQETSVTRKDGCGYIRRLFSGVLKYGARNHVDHC